METWQALILGVIEGITEYLPISSTGHLVVAQRLMGIGTLSHTDKVAADAFAICIQGGAILAVVGLYWQRVLQMIRGVLGKDQEGLRLAILILASFLPTAVLALGLSHWIKDHLFGITPIVVAWIVGGLAILGTVWWRKGHPVRSGEKEMVQMTLVAAVVIGLLQSVAMCPGTSRSLMTICAGLLVGLTARAAVEYSFLLGVLTLTAATAKDAVGKIEGLDPAYNTLFGGAKLMLHEFGATNLVVGGVSAAVFAAIAVKWLVAYLQSHGLSVFGWYRIAIGVLVGGLVWAGVVAG